MDKKIKLVIAISLVLLAAMLGVIAWYVLYYSNLPEGCVRDGDEVYCLTPIDVIRN